MLLGGLQGTFDPVTGNFRPEFRQLVSMNAYVCVRACMRVCVGVHLFVT